MIVYHHVKNELVQDAVRFGMKLSDFADKSIKTTEGVKSVILAYISPADDKEKFENEEYTALALSVNMDKTYIIEGAYMRMDNVYALSSSLVRASEYNLGLYREPLALITTSLFSENVKVLDKYMDVPIIVENSVELYLKNNLAELEETDSQYYEKALAGYLQFNKEAVKTSEKNGLAEYQYKGKKYIVKRDK